MLALSFNYLFLLAGAGGDNDDEEVVIFGVDDDSDVEDTDDENDDDLSSSSILFSKMKFHINESAAILWNDYVFIPIPFTRVGVVINRPSQPICSSIMFGDCSLLLPILTT